MPRRKVTPFARFMLAMIIIVPLAFAGASYINGEDPIANFKSLTGMEATEQPQEAPAQDRKPKEKPADKPATESIEALKKENARLKREIKERDQAIKDLQEQLKNSQ
jgi:predicted RNase H-like nuclease (RuvC/YqgF family)